MKKILVGIMCVVLLMSSFAFAAGEIIEKPDFNLLVNSVPLDKTDVPILIDGRTLVPLRTLAVALGVPNDEKHIIWNPQNKKVSVINDNVSIELIIDSNVAIVNGVEKTIDVSATLYKGRTYLPARFIAESFAKHVGWDESTGTVTISDEPIEVVEPVITDNDAAALMKKSEEAMKNVKSMKMDLIAKMQINQAETSASADMKGNMSIDLNSKQMYGDFDVSVNTSGLVLPIKLSMYMDNNKIYMKTDAMGQDSGWVAAEEGVSTEEVWNLAEQSDTLSTPDEFYTAFEIAGTEGNYTIVSTKDDVAEMINSIMNQIIAANQEIATLESIMANIGKLDYKMYINNSNYYTDKAEMQMNMDTTAEGETVSVSMDMSMNMSGFNSTKVTRPAI